MKEKGFMYQTLKVSHTGFVVHVLAAEHEIKS